MKYTIQELAKLRSILLSSFDPGDPYDDNHTNKHSDFAINTDIFLIWLYKMERAGKIEYLLENFKA
jgi:hypothetical protein